MLRKLKTCTEDWQICDFSLLILVVHALVHYTVYVGLHITTDSELTYNQHIYHKPPGMLRGQIWQLYYDCSKMAKFWPNLATFRLQKWLNLALYCSKLKLAKWKNSEPNLATFRLLTNCRKYLFYETIIAKRQLLLSKRLILAVLWN